MNETIERAAKALCAFDFGIDPNAGEEVEKIWADLPEDEVAAHLRRRQGNDCGSSNRADYRSQVLILMAALEGQSS